ncbi:lytic polysaccharide monooxygenase [Chromobacterium haemolyticum]|uniref:lytic polysaccharide monooxygenase n=2 Tax=Chromobacterium haemolyticum TaxID=394935 RepID=UPI0009EFA478|nr:lytic polysaccharide monooxygenase [Chromobacterium haemolyticum]OQS32215.1 hypothetical protein B0T39_22930 [Chromobacterium haemolyticum]
MSQSRKAGSFALPALALSQIAASLMLLAPVAASAHGSMEEPISRIKYCHSADNPESPRTPGCQAVKQGGGSQAIYDWNSVLQGSAHGNHQQVVPNGKLCAGGAKKFGGLDAAVDWPATTIQPGPDGKYTMTYHQTAQHQTAYFKSYISKDSYDFKRPLKWDDLQLIGDSGAVAPSAKTKLDVKIPAGMQGKRVIYNVWQRSDSGEAFYSCSDVDIVANNVDFKPLGPLVSRPFDAKLDTTITLRIFNKLRGTDLEKHSIKIAAGQTAANDWTYALATEANAKSSVVKVGQLENGKVVPVKNAAANTVFGLGKEYSFALEQSDEGGKPPVDEIPPGKVTVSGPASVNGGANVSLSAKPAAGTNLKYQWTVSPSIAGLPLNAAVLNFKAPTPKQDTRYTFQVKVSNVMGSQSASHQLLVKADNAPPPVEGSWDAAKTYAQPCAKVTYGGKEWTNGWWTKGTVPGSDGKWGVWRAVGAAEMHGQCKGK